jgi:hypothetical protein
MASTRTCGIPEHCGNAAERRSLSGQLNNLACRALG